MVREYVLAASPEEASELVAEDPEAIVMGGGTTLMPRVTLGELGDKRVIGLANAGLDYVRTNGATTLGATAPLGAVAALDRPAILVEAARSIGGRALRTTATVGGNVLATQPYGDLVPALLALDAEVVLAGDGGRRTVPLSEALASDADTARPEGVAGAEGEVDARARPPLALVGEVLIEIAVPAASGGTSFQRCARVAAGAPSVVTVAARVRRSGDEVSEARIALGALGPRPLRASAAEERLVGSAGDAGAVTDAVAAAVEATDPADDSVASAWYRRRMTELHVRRAIEAALTGSEAQG